ncbi:MAG: hypothetical protein AAB036_05215 [Elusimicrobiota bacterium]
MSAAPALLLALLTCVPARAASIRLFAFDGRSAPYTAEGLATLLSRADARAPSLDTLPLWAVPMDGKSPRRRLALAPDENIVRGSWEHTPRVRLELIWPVFEDGYNSVVADNNGEGFIDGDTVYLDEEIAVTQYRRFKDMWKRRISDWQPLYKPTKKAKDLSDAAKDAMAAAAREKDTPSRAKLYKRALNLVSLAWQHVLFEHALQHGLDERHAPTQRFGLTIDEGILKRLDDLDWIVKAVHRSGANWVRLVFRANSGDFTYSSLRSFNEYDGVVELLSAKRIKVMGCILDTTQWPKTLTPGRYAERVKNIVLHYRGKISSWEVGSEINGDWLGGVGAPLSIEDAYKIYSSGVDKVKEIDPALETVATLYGWEETAPDVEHSVSGWLERHAKHGFGRNLDIVGLSVQPEDNPAGMGLERLFTIVSDAMPAQKLMLTSLGFVEKDTLQGYWWLDPHDIDGARKDIAVLYTAVSCAMPRSLCGAFWWQTLEQMLPPGRRKGTELFKAWRRVLGQFGRRED